MESFVEAEEQLKQMDVDKRILRYLVTGAVRVNSTVVKDPLGCRYIYVKSGYYDDLLKISNIDFVQQIYVANGIPVSKHVSHMGDKEQEVLFIPVSDVLQLTDVQQKFLDSTAPYTLRAGNDKEANSRSVEIVNAIIKQKNSLLPKTVQETR